MPLSEMEPVILLGEASGLDVGNDVRDGVGDVVGGEGMLSDMQSMTVSLIQDGFVAAVGDSVVDDVGESAVGNVVW